MRTMIYLVGGLVGTALARSHADAACGKASRRGGFPGAPAADGQAGGRVMSTGRTASRTVAALVTLAALGGGVPLAIAPPAAALPGLERVEGISGPSTNSPRIVQAFCPFGKVVVGGGAEIEGGGEDPATQPRLTRLVPGAPVGNQFIVTAETPSHASEEPWLLRAYAICADVDALDGYQIVGGSSANDSQTFKDAQTVRCPEGTVAYGAGGAIMYPDGPEFPPPGRVGLQTVRPSGPLDIGRAAGREYDDGYDGNWQVAASAICAAPAGGIHAEGTIEQVGEPDFSTHQCSSGTFVHGAGGGGGLIDGGDVYLRDIIPNEELTEVFVRLTAPIDPSIGVDASVTCAE
jgi:hypothetical protein